MRRINLKTDNETLARLRYHATLRGLSLQKMLTNLIAAALTKMDEEERAKCEP